MDEKTYNQLMGQRIRDMRKAREMTLRELGERVGISESTTKRYEDGQIKAVSIEIVRRFAAALMTTPAYLMGWRDEDGKETPDFDPATLPSHSQKPMTITSEKEKSLVKKYRVLDDTGKASVDAILDVQYNAAMAGKYEIEEKMA